MEGTVLEEPQLCSAEASCSSAPSQHDADSQTCQNAGSSRRLAPPLDLWEVSVLVSTFTFTSVTRTDRRLTATREAEATLRLLQPHSMA